MSKPDRPDQHSTLLGLFPRSVRHLCRGPPGGGSAGSGGEGIEITNLTELPSRRARIIVLAVLLLLPMTAAASGSGFAALRSVPVERAEADGARTGPTTTGRTGLGVRARRPTPTTTAPSSTTVEAPTSTAIAPATVPPAPDPVVNRPPPRPDRSAPAPSGSSPEVSEGSEAVYRDDFPDPSVIRANGSWWAFSTQVGLSKVPTLRSDDLLSWERVGDALTQVPAWSDCCHVWGPSALARTTSYVLYYTTRHAATGLQCISRATSPLPQGPYLDSSDQPLVCQTERGGSIDPSPFVAPDGRVYLLWKSEGTLHGEPTRLWSQELRSDGLELVGPRRELLHRSLPWEFPIIEGPAMALVDGRFHLLYSGNRWETSDYAVGHAVCASPLGPCQRSSSTPILTSRPGAAGPGGQDVVRLPGGGFLLAHHAWDPAAVGYPEGARMLHLSRLRGEGGRLSVGGSWREGASSGLLGTPG